MPAIQQPPSPPHIHRMKHSLCGSHVATARRQCAHSDGLKSLTAHTGTEDRVLEFSLPVKHNARDSDHNMSDRAPRDQRESIVAELFALQQLFAFVLASGVGHEGETA